MAKYDLRNDPVFKELLMAQRAAKLKEVDDIEIFLRMPRTKHLRKAVKKAAHLGNVTISAFIGEDNG